MLVDAGLQFDCAFTSVLKRSIKTLFYIQDALDLHWIPVYRHWRLNERMYGDLQGRNKSDTAKKHGEAQVKIWRRSFDIPPPAITRDDERWAGHDRRYQEKPAIAGFVRNSKRYWTYFAQNSGTTRYVDKQLIPLTECLKDTQARILPCWYDVIVPEIKKNQQVLIVAHGSTVRSLFKHLNKISDKEIMSLNIPTGMPVVFELDADLEPIRHYYLASDAVVKAATDKIVAQGKIKPDNPQ